MAAPRTVALVMAGGSGTRFWPLSRKALPKQYVSVKGEGSLIQQTVRRLYPLLDPSDVCVCAHYTHHKILQDQLPGIGRFFLEPQAKNTTACLMYSTAQLLKDGLDPSTRMVALPADHYIERPDRLREILAFAVDFCSRHDTLVTLGIAPTKPHTGYGYIQAGESLEPGAYSVDRFIEKPDRDRAQTLLNSGKVYWNSGIFVWSIKALVAAFEEFMGPVWGQMQTAVARGAVDSVYSMFPPVAIDVAVMEKAKSVCVISACDLGWSDLGSWGALYELERPATNGNLTLGGMVKAVQSEGCLVRAAEKRKVALVGVKNLIVVEEGDTLLIVHRDSDQLVRDAAAQFDP